MGMAKLRDPGWTRQLTVFCLGFVVEGPHLVVLHVPRLVGAVEEDRVPRAPLRPPALLDAGGPGGVALHPGEHLVANREWLLLGHSAFLPLWRRHFFRDRCLFSQNRVCVGVERVRNWGIRVTP